MDALRQWALCLIIGAAAGTFAIAISPRGATDKTMRAVVGIFVVAAMCAPLSQLKGAELSVAAFGGGGDYEEIDAENLREYMLTVCVEAARTQVDAAAEEIGITVSQAAVNASLGSDNCIIIHDITVIIDERFSEKSDDFEKLLSERLGVPATVNAN